MKKHVALLAAAGSIIGAAASLPAQADPPSWAPAHGYRAQAPQVREYRYVYYPERQIYYAPATHNWFWLNGGTWQVSVDLPGQFRGFVDDGGVPVVLDTSRPYTQHVYVEQHYGRPWREQHHYRGDYRRDDHRRDDRRDAYRDDHRRDDDHGRDQRDWHR